MSKILIIGDAHFKLDLSYSSYFEDGRRNEWNAVKNKIQDVAKSCDAVVFMGDNLNSKNNHSAVNAEFVSFLQGFGDKQIHLLVGNHERAGKVTALDFLKKFNHPNWRVYTEPEKNNIVTGKPETAMFVPYLTTSMVEAKDNEDGVIKSIEVLEPADIAFFHQGITGSKVHGQMVDLFNEIVFQREIIESKYNRIFAGHIHEAQELSPKTTITGSLFTSEVGEEYKYLFVYDTESNITEKIKLPERGIYKVTLPGDLLDSIPKESIVKCYITDKSIDVEKTKEELSKFDAYVIIEQYPNERTKLHVENSALDLSLDNILKMYSSAKSIEYSKIQKGFDLIK